MQRKEVCVLVAWLTAIAGSVSSPAEARAFLPPAVLAKPKPPLTGKKPVAVGTIAGKRAGKVRALIFERLKESNAYEVADTEDLKPGDNKATIAKTSKSLAVTGVIMGRVSDKFDLTLVIYKADGKLVREVTIKGGTPEKLENAVRNEFNLLAGEAIAQATGGKNLAEVKPPTEEVVEEEEEEDEPGAKKKKPKEEEEQVEEEEDKPKEEEKDEGKDKDKDKDEDEDEGKKSDKPSKPGRTPFEFLAGMRGYNRQFGYTKATTKVLPYSLPFGPALLAGGRIYPAAFFVDDFSGNFGLVAQGELGIATSTDYTTPVSTGGSIVKKLKTSAQEWSIGLIARLPIDPVEIDVFGVYGQQTFILLGDENRAELSPLVPDVKYSYIRPGVELRGRFSKVLAGAHVAPRFLLSLAQIDLEGVWFPGATGSGLDFGLMGGYAVLPYLDVVAGFDYVRYGFDFSAIPKNRPTCASVVLETPPCQKVAAGASDTYVSGWVGAMVHFGGSDAEKK